jgi:hypothetical protein
MAQQITFNGTHEELRRLLYSFVASLSGRTGAYAPYVRGIKLRVGMTALACVQEAFVVKADGGVGDDGISWEPLKKATIAARRIGPGDVPGLKALGITKRQFGYGARRQGQGDLDVKGRLKRGFLTQAEDKRWKMIFATRKMAMMARHGMSEEAAAGRAAQIAWATLKAEGAKTRLEVLGNRHVQIGRDTGRMLASLSPGVVDPMTHPLTADPEIGEETILREEPGAVIVGTTTEYAGRFHAQRPLWPANNELPPPWSKRIEEAAKSGVLEAITMILETQP